MNASRWTAALAALLLLLGCAAPGAWAAGWREKKDVEQGGWKVAYGNQLTERDAARGAVAPGVNIYAGRGSMEMESVHNWADALIRQAEAMMASSLGAGSGRDFGQQDRWQARRLAVRTVRDLLRSRQNGEESMNFGTVEFKAGVLQYREHRGDWGRQDGWNGGGGEVFVPYVGLRQQDRGGYWPQQDGYEQNGPIQGQHPDWHGQDHGHGSRHYGPSSSEVLNAFSLTNTARRVSHRRWLWTARIEGPDRYLRQISSVKYYLHPSFTPNVQYGNSAQPGHPLSATGWGTFVLRAEVTLHDGTRRVYEHRLQF